MTAAPQRKTAQPVTGLAAYKVGDGDTRPWGSYVVTGAGALPEGGEYCEKLITVQPGKILSLQSHDHRAEQWRVEEGTLTVICGGERLTLNAGESVDIPRGAIHCMANLTAAPVKVYEKQTGLCREEDIIRYLDAYGRGTQTADGQSEKSVALYSEVMEEIESRSL